MPTDLELAALHALRAATNARLGVSLRIETPGGESVVTPALRAKQIIYRFRKALGDPQFAKIQVRLSPDDPDHRLWLINTADIGFVSSEAASQQSALAEAAEAPPPTIVTLTDEDL